MSALFLPYFWAFLCFVFLCLSFFPALLAAAIALYVNEEKGIETHLAQRKAIKIGGIVYATSLLGMCGIYTIYLFTSPFYLP